MHVPHLSMTHRVYALSHLLHRYSLLDPATTASLTDPQVFPAFDLDGNLLVVASGMLTDADPDTVFVRPSALAGWTTARRDDPHWVDLPADRVAPVARSRVVYFARQYRPANELLAFVVHEAAPMAAVLELVTPHSRRRRLPTMLTTPAGDAVPMTAELAAVLAG